MPPVPRVSGRDLVRALRRAGWRLARIEGSHYLMEGVDGKVVSVPVHGAKTLPIGTIKGIMDDLGMGAEELVRLLKD